ncbi:unnamed protein product [Moneuplotes crassus]|uniref:RING-type domain-containing protein n=1 Tax=Euplotes crassus TaxID=5936 RepID=A0AAD1UJI5_EUPCR|nr:unnamed protein product [Moneuplotes crassus]
MLCPICYINIEVEDQDPLECGHIFHPECIRMHIEAKVDARSLPIPCPDYKCGTMLTRDEADFFSDEKLYNRLEKLQKELIILQSNNYFIQCPEDGCEFMGEWDKNEEETSILCTDCNSNYCAICRVPFHHGKSCDEYCEETGKIKKHPDLLTLNHFQYLIQSKLGFQRCTNCDLIILKEEGCNHIRCICGYNLCYTCGGRYGHCRCIH